MSADSLRLFLPDKVMKDIPAASAPKAHEIESEPVKRNMSAHVMEEIAAARNLIFMCATMIQEEYLYLQIYRREAEFQPHIHILFRSSSTEFLFQLDRFHIAP